MRDISFTDFYLACVSKLTDEQLRCLNPKAEYFQVGDSYFGITQHPQGIWIDIAVGGMRGIWDFKALLLKTKSRFVGWQARMDTPSYELARYYGARITDTSEVYPDGSIAWLCEIDTQQSQRLSKDKPKELVLA